MVKIENRGVTRHLSKPIPERIKEAREARGFTLEKFAAALGKSRQAVAQFETGQTAPSGETLSSIIALTQQPLAFFVSSPSRPGNAGTVFWRSLKRMEQHSRKRIAKRLQWSADIVGMVDEYIELPTIDIPHWEFDPETAGNDEIEEAAEFLRDYWGLGRGPIANLGATLESKGIILIRENVDCPDMDGVSCWINGRPYILLSGEVISGPRDLYNLAHELGHLFLHAIAEVNDKNIDMIERQANRFASAFLMPMESFSKEVFGTSIEFFKSLKKRWGVAIAAMAYRCKDLNIISENQFSYIFRQMNAQKIRKIEPLDDAFDVARPTVLGESIRMLVEHGVCKRPEIEGRLGLNLRDVERLCGVDDGYLDTRVVSIQFRPAANQN
jgi:Zn-dependent peptidase ImmA (M78 family)/transcriptional regulator with XRE-family HTH domain